MQGRRLPDGDERLLSWPHPGARPGDYGLYHGYTGDKLALFFIKPNGSRGHITFGGPDDHTYEEHEDGSITVNPSISNLKRDDPGDGSTDDGWHGYLESGVWRQV